MYQPVYGYGQPSQQSQDQQPQEKRSPTQQYAYNQQSYSADSNNGRIQTSLPNFNAYMSSQEQHSNTNSPTIPHEQSMDKVDSPHFSHKSKDEFQQQQFSYNSSIRDVPSSQQIKSPTQFNNHTNTFGTAPGYRHMNSSAATSPIQQQQYTRNDNGHGRFSSQDIVAGLTQPITTTNNTPNRIVNNHELPTLPPLNTSSPQSNVNTMNRPRERWISDEESRPLVNNNTMIPSSSQPDPSVLIQYHKPDPSVLIQYHNMGNNNRDDRRLMSAPYPHPQQRHQDMFPNTSDPYTDVGPYGCGVMGCFASFAASSGLFTHMKEVHKNAADIYKPYRCAMPTCPKRYKNINGLQYHLREAKGSSGHGNVASEENANMKPYQCQISGCKKAYRTANGLRYHHQNGHITGPPLQHIVNALQEQQYQLRMQQQQQHTSHLLQSSIHQQQQAHSHAEAQTHHAQHHQQQQQQTKSQPRFIGHPR